jgi:diacylglycerol O-acyltransferase/trehalose O-mycolyltransferase
MDVRARVGYMGRSRLIRILVAVALSIPIGAVPASASTALTADDGARVVATTRVDARTLDLTIDSPALGRTGKVRLLLPPDFARRAHERWPVLYLLHGCCDDYTSWTRSTDVATLTSRTNVMVVTPEAGAVGFYSNWWNGGAGGPPAWETFHLTEVRQIVERGYRASDRRAVAGLSMGGFGALSYAARHPHMFRAAASYSGVLNPTGDPQNLLKLVGYFAPDPLALWGDPVRQAAVWNAHDPTVRAPDLRGMPVYVSSGNGQPGPLDKPGTGFDPNERAIEGYTMAFVDRAHAAHVRVTTDFYGPGTHDWPYWQRALHRSYDLLMCAIGARRAGA